MFLFLPKVFLFISGNVKHILKLWKEANRIFRQSARLLSWKQAAVQSQVAIKQNETVELWVHVSAVQSSLKTRCTWEKTSSQFLNMARYRQQDPLTASLSEAAEIVGAESSPFWNQRMKAVIQPSCVQALFILSGSPAAFTQAT